MDPLHIVIDSLPTGSAPKFNVFKFIVDLLPALVGIVGMLIAYRQFKMSIESAKEQLKMSLDAEFKRNALEDRRREITSKLNEFYGPLQQHRLKSSLLYDRFRKNYYPVDENFRTLDYLLREHEFSEPESVLLAEIIEIGKKCEDLIKNKSGLIDNDELDAVMPQFLTHISILRLAFEGKLKGEPDDYQMHRFPRDIDAILKRRIESLKSELRELSSNPPETVNNSV